MSKKLIATMIMALILTPLLPAIMATTAELKIKTDSKIYAPGDKVTVTVNSTNKINLNVTIYRYGNDTKIYFNDSLKGTAQAYIAEWKIPLDVKAGKYKAVASQNTTSVSTDFVINKEKSDVLALEMIEKAREANKTTYDLIKDDNSLSPAVRNNYNKGNESLAKVEELYAAGNYTVAISMAHNALVHFGNAVKIYEHDKEGVDDDVYEAFGLIERLNKTVTKLNQTAENMEDLSAEKLNQIKGLVGDARLSLSEAKDLLLNGKMKAVQEKLKQVKEIIKEIEALLKKQANENKSILMEKFMNQMGKRLDRLNDKINALKEKEHQKWQGLGAQLDAMQKQLVKLRGRINSEMNNLFDELDQIRVQINTLEGQTG